MGSNDLSKIHDKVIDLYVNQLYSADKVAEVLSNSDFPVCGLTVLRYLKKCGLVRKRGAAAFFANGVCDFCGRSYTRTSPRNKYCEFCVKNGNRYLITRFGINNEIFEEAKRAQNNACAICKISFSLTKVYVDHDHKTGKFRGLLCNRCNVALGYVESSLIDEMLIYLGRA